jgi:hypothetical protein
LYSVSWQGRKTGATARWSAHWRLGALAAVSIFPIKDCCPVGGVHMVRRSACASFGDKLTEFQVYYLPTLSLQRLQTLGLQACDRTSVVGRGDLDISCGVSRWRRRTLPKIKKENSNYSTQTNVQGLPCPWPAAWLVRTLEWHPWPLLRGCRGPRRGCTSSSRRGHTA